MKKLKNYWDFLTQDGHTYQMGAQSHRVYLLNLLNKKGVESILDVGCGTGPIYQLIKQTQNGDEPNPSTEYYWTFDYKGTDYSEGMIDVCKKEFPEGDFEVEDARHLTEADNSWDCVLLMHCLDHLDDYKAAINEAARVAKKYVLIVLWRSLTASEENNLNDRNDYGLEGTGKRWEDTFLHEYSERKLKDAFEEAGLEMEFQTAGEEINKEGRYNTLFLLRKK